ncbi:MAG: THUMP domain-containing class I SAM-dependent RNA methyltransferase [Halanaerobiaceae bacterium]
MQKLDLIATSTFGLEAIIKEEIQELGCEIQEVKNGKITFSGDLFDLCRANIWLRCAERVLLKIGSFQARTFDELYEKTRDLPWPNWLPKNAEFPVSGNSVKSKLHNVPSCQSIVKKAVVDSMQEKYGIDRFPENGSLYPIQISLYKDQALLTLDTSGKGLHKRGYRELSSTAPLQETIAAGMIYLSKWNPDRIVIDPFCGSGTIPIEAALMGKNIAPGSKRSFVSEMWPVIPPRLWNKAREEARDKIDRSLKPRLIMGTDRNGEVLDKARYHAQKAGVDDIIHFQQLDFSEFETSRNYGYIITNPPYGERMEETKKVAALYHQMGKKLLPLETWSFYILTANTRFEKKFGKEASKRRKLYNGGIECQYYQYYGPWPPRS